VRCPEKSCIFSSPPENRSLFSCDWSSIIQNHSIAENMTLFSCELLENCPVCSHIRQRNILWKAKFAFIVIHKLAFEEDITWMKVWMSFSGDEWAIPFDYCDTNQWMKTNLTCGLKVWTNSDEHVALKNAQNCWNDLGGAYLFYWAFSSRHEHLKPCDILNLFLLVYDYQIGLLWNPTYRVFFLTGAPLKFTSMGKN